MEEFKGTKLTLEIDGEKAVWESPSRDHDVYDILQALRGLMVAHTFLDESVIKGCGGLYDENIELYERKEKEVD
jgi:hypothetical protein